MKFKKILSLIIIMCTIVLTGCANVGFSRMIDGNNALQDELIIELDKGKLESSGYSVIEVANKIESDFIGIKNYIEKTWIEQFNTDELANVYDMTKKGIKVNVANNNKLHKVTLTITFSDLAVFGLFYGYSTIDNNHNYTKALEDVGPFVSKMLTADYSNENYGWFLYKYSLIKDNGILENLEDFEVNGVNYYTNYSNYFSDDFSLDDLDISEIFYYPDDRIYSNADDKEVIGGITCLYWSLSDKNENFQMEIYKIAPRVISWYILAIVISVLFVIIAIAVIVYKTLKKKKKFEVTNE